MPPRSRYHAAVAFLALGTLLSFTGAGCTMILNEKPAPNATSAWSGIVVNVTSPVGTISIGAQSALSLSGTAKPSALEKGAARITTIKIKWPTGEIQSYDPNLPIGVVTVNGGVTSVASQNWSISVAPILATSGSLLVWVEDSWGFYSDAAAFALNP